MKIIIRADASTEIGSGHIMRCLTIANHLKKRGHEILFYMLPLPGNLINYIETCGYDVIAEWREVDIIIVDHYQIDAQIEKQLYIYAKKIVVIDDLANRAHECDVLLDQNIVADYENRYNDLVPEHCQKLLGPRYLIMRDEFIDIRQNRRERNYQVENLLIFMGGTDPTHETMKVLKALETFSFSKVNIVCGNGNEQKELIQSICNERGYQYHQQINYMASLMNEADFSIGAGGLTTWERCYVGVPSSSTIVADNQSETTYFTEKLGAVWNVGWHEAVTSTTYEELLNSIQQHPELLQQISEQGLRLTNNNTPNPWIKELLEMNI